VASNLLIFLRINWPRCMHFSTGVFVQFVFTKVDIMWTRKTLVCQIIGPAAAASVGLVPTPVLNCDHDSLLLWWQCNVMYFRFCGWRHVFTNRTGKDDTTLCGLPGPARLTRCNQSYISRIGVCIVASTFGRAEVWKSIALYCCSGKKIITFSEMTVYKIIVIILLKTDAFQAL